MPFSFSSVLYIRKLTYNSRVWLCLVGIVFCLIIDKVDKRKAVIPVSVCW